MITMTTGREQANGEFFRTIRPALVGQWAQAAREDIEVAVREVMTDRTRQTVPTDSEGEE